MWVSAIKGIGVILSLVPLVKVILGAAGIGDLPTPEEIQLAVTTTAGGGILAGSPAIGRTRKQEAVEKAVKEVVAEKVKVKSLEKAIEDV